MLLLSDLRGAPGPGLQAVLPAMRRRKVRLIVLTPEAARLEGGVVRDARAVRIEGLLKWAEDPRRTPMARALRAAGATVLVLGPSDPLTAVLRKLAHLRAA